jgi:hypothetical protein
VRRVYEWKVMESGRKQPYCIKPANEETFATISRARAAANATGSNVGRAIRGPDYQVAENGFSTA